MPEKEDKIKDSALEEAIKSIEKAYGKGSVMRLGDQPHVDVDVIPSGSLLLDQALGVGGYPKGRVVEIYGPESSGKTTLALHAVAEAQKKGGRAAYVDAEHAIDPEYAAKLGVDIDELILSQPDSGEQALDIVEMLAQSGAIDVIVVDSVAALVPQAELDGVMTDNQVGLPGPFDVQGDAQTHWHPLQERMLGHLHQPAPRESRHCLWQSRSHDRWPCLKILRLHPS
jgi:recombination protein RecA